MTSLPSAARVGYHRGGELPASSDSRRSFYLHPQSSATLFWAPSVCDSGRIRKENARYCVVCESGSLWGQVRAAKPGETGPRLGYGTGKPPEGTAVKLLQRIRHRLPQKQKAELRHGEQPEPLRARVAFAPGHLAGRKGPVFLTLQPKPPGPHLAAAAVLDRVPFPHGSPLLLCR